MRIAALQYTARDDLAINCDIALRLIKAAVENGATTICLPECANLLAKDKDSLFAKAETENSSAFLAMIQSAAIAHDIWVSVGSMMIRDAAYEDDRIANRQFIISPKGKIIARYDKIHMFDADVNDGQTYRESSSFRPGKAPCLTHIDGHKTGLSICYDIRFAGLYHHYARNQAEMIFTPAAFTARTGAAHWHVLQRSRAIETGAFIIAAAQKGTHDDNRQTYGHALIISPWGEVLADAGPDGDMAVADIDFDEVTKARARLQAWRAQTAF
ncbi:MAG: carbon-nitrogen hydrolase family protein [Candidatus Puniceispirillaceae bacterium]